METEPVQSTSMTAPLQSITNNIQNSISGIQSNLDNQLQQFSKATEVSPGFPTSFIPSSFLDSNSMIAKIGFIIMVLIVFMFALNLGASILGYLLKEGNSSPYIVYGALDGYDNKIIPTDPKQPNSVNIARSNNQTNGAEFTYSVWLNIRNNKTENSICQHIFNKGDTIFSGAQNVAVTNAPGMYLTKNENTGECFLRFIMDTVDPSVPTQVIDVKGIPYNQWFHVAVRLENKLLDVYVNGTITNRLALSAVPKQNYNDINLCQNGGFAGRLSNLRYYNYALSVFEINAVIIGGPNTSPSSLSSGAKHIPYFLSNMWYNTQYNMK